MSSNELAGAWAAAISAAMSMDLASYADAEGGKVATIKNPFGPMLDLEFKREGDGLGKFSDDSSWNI